MRKQLKVGAEGIWNDTVSCQYGFIVFWASYTLYSRGRMFGQSLLSALFSTI